MESDPQNLLKTFFSRPQDNALLKREHSQGATPGNIPRVIHQIWLGSPLPSHLTKYRETWLRHHPQWEFKLWTDDEVQQANFETAGLINSSTCFGQKSDILRAEILKREGGVYVDLDYECYRSLDGILKGTEKFFATLRWIPQAHLGWPALFPQPLIICNSLFGAEKEHPLLAEYLLNVRAGWNDRDKLDLRDKELDRISLFALGGKRKASRLKETALRTYLPFESLLRDRIANVTLYPPAYFNPIIERWPALYAMPNFWRNFKDSGVFPRFWRYSKVLPTTVARHRSKASWL